MSPDRIFAFKHNSVLRHDRMATYFAEGFLHKKGRFTHISYFTIPTGIDMGCFSLRIPLSGKKNIDRIWSHIGIGMVTC